jgi:hypothetical protein
MEEELYRVVFAGVLTGEYNLQTTKKRFARLFRLDARRTDVLFSGKEYVVKNNSPEDIAMALAMKISEVGCECYVQVITDEDDVDYDEKRELGERRLRFRRGPRPGAIVPDRRLEIRRKKDRTYFLDIRKNSHEMPISFQSYRNVEVENENNA